MLGSRRDEERQTHQGSGINVDVIIAWECAVRSSENEILAQSSLASGTRLELPELTLSVPPVPPRFRDLFTLTS